MRNLNTFYVLVIGIVFSYEVEGFFHGESRHNSQLENLMTKLQKNSIALRTLNSKMHESDVIWRWFINKKNLLDMVLAKQGTNTCYPGNKQFNQLIQESCLKSVQLLQDEVQRNLTEDFNQQYQDKLEAIEQYSMAMKINLNKSQSNNDRLAKIQSQLLEEDELQENLKKSLQHLTQSFEAMKLRANESNSKDQQPTDNFTTKSITDKIETTLKNNLDLNVSTISPVLIDGNKTSLQPDDTLVFTKPILPPPNNNYDEPINNSVNYSDYYPDYI